MVINTASVAAFDGQIGQVAYSASKGAIVGKPFTLTNFFMTVCQIQKGKRPHKKEHHNISCFEDLGLDVLRGGLSKSVIGLLIIF